MLFDFASLLVCVCIFPLTGALKHGTVARANGVGDKFAIAADLLMDAKMQVEQMDGLTKEVEALTADVGAGEDKARRALARLIELSSQPNSKWVIEKAGAAAEAAKLMSKADSSDDIQRLAGSLVTRVTDMPVTSESSEEKTGSYGRVHIIIPRPSRVYRPDRSIIELAAGVQPSATSAGDYMLSSDVDD